MVPRAPGACWRKALEIWGAFPSVKVTGAVTWWRWWWSFVGVAATFNAIDAQEHGRYVTSLEDWKQTCCPKEASLLTPVSPKPSNLVELPLKVSGHLLHEMFEVSSQTLDVRAARFHLAGQRSARRHGPYRLCLRSSTKKCLTGAIHGQCMFFFFFNETITWAA